VARDNVVALRAPGSKSQTQRALLLGALAHGETRLHGALACDDSRVLAQALRDLGARVDSSVDPWVVTGGPLRPAPGPLWCGDAGTALRFLAPLSLLLDGPLTLDGSTRLSQRPLTPLLDALATCGVASSGAAGRPLPVTLVRQGTVPDSVAVEASQSSQFASGLMLVAPLLPRGMVVRLSADAPAVSTPYLHMTARCLSSFGGRVEEVPGGYHVFPGAPRPTSLAVEADWSAAAFLLVAGVAASANVVVTNAAADSVQGDRAIVDMLRELGVARPHRFDLTHCPDLLAPLAAACALSSSPSEIVGAAHARLKESDRVAAMAEGLARVGVAVEERPDGLVVRPGPPLRPATVDSRGDHRVAMAFGVLSLRQPGIAVTQPGCVSKSFPGFWEAVANLRRT
jgi:3-phosphoshikimate 1-carboxyvinyltransferase